MCYDASYTNCHRIYVPSIIYSIVESTLELETAQYGKLIQHV